MAGTSIPEYSEARKLGMKEYRRAIMNGTSPYPPVLDDIISNINSMAEYPVGMVEIPMDFVVGTKTAGRTNSFSTSFYPILSETSEFAWKWGDLYKSQEEVGIRDPIKAYEFMHRFYVEEGNKRVSVSRFVGQTSIMANVTRVMPKGVDEKELRIYQEFLQFFKVAPTYEIDFSREGCYAKLAEIFGEDLEHRWSDESMENLKASYGTFKNLFQTRKEKNGGSLELSPSDAFLIYLTFYPAESLINDTDTLIGSRIDRLWNEFQTQTSDDKIALVENPDEIQRGSGILDRLRFAPSYTARKPLRIAFIYDRNPEDSRWIYGHELGRMQVNEHYEGRVEAIKFENCDTDEKLAHAIDAAAADNDEMVFTISPTMMEETLRSAIHYPKIRFLNCSINLSHQAVRTYYGKMHEAKFIMGAIAATAAENHRIGYLADYPIYGIVAGINAFAIGAAMVDPFVKVYLEWSTTPGVDWHQRFLEEEVHVISGPDMIKPKDPSREYGIYSVDASGTHNLAAPVWNWGKYYELIIDDVLDGSYEAKDIARNDQAVNYWWGMSSGVIDVILSDHLSYYTKKLVGNLRDGIIRGVSPFKGELHSQDGLIKSADSPDLTSEQIITMNWLCDNVVGHIPDMSELNDEAKDAASVSGVEDVDKADK